MKKKRYFLNVRSMLRLERDNAHVRDARIAFNEKDHFYTVDSRRVVGSVSSLWASYFSGFDAPGTALRLAAWGSANRHS